MNRYLVNCAACKRWWTENVPEGGQKWPGQYHDCPVIYEGPPEFWRSRFGATEIHYKADAHPRKCGLECYNASRTATCGCECKGENHGRGIEVRRPDQPMTEEERAKLDALYSRLEG